SVVPLSPPLEYNRDVPWLQHTSHRHGRGRIHLQKGHLPVRVTAYMKGSPSGLKVRSEPRLGGPRGGRIRAAKGRGGEAGCCRLPAPSLREEAPAARSWRGPRGARGEGEAPASPAGAGGAVGPDEEEERRTSGGEGGPGLAAGPTSRLELPLGPQEPAALGRAPPARQQGLPGRGGEQPRVL
ncbi:unnamed protein product, partial [Prorocentrum cordatum]